jgi:hypothetical protein
MGNPEVMPPGLVPRNALVLPEPISSDRPVESSRAPGHLIGDNAYDSDKLEPSSDITALK